MIIGTIYFLLFLDAPRLQFLVVVIGCGGGCGRAIRGCILWVHRDLERSLLGIERYTMAEERKRPVGK